MGKANYSTPDTLHKPAPTYYEDTQKHCLHCGEWIRFDERLKKWVAARDEFKCEANNKG